VEQLEAPLSQLETHEVAVFKKRDNVTDSILHGITEQVKMLRVNSFAALMHSPRDV
jgi:hypothetical protein